MYRVLLKSMYLVCSGYQVTTHSGAAVNDLEPVYNPWKQNGNQAFRQPIRLAARVQSIQPSDANLYRPACGLTARCFADFCPLSRHGPGPSQRGPKDPVTRELEDA